MAFQWMCFALRKVNIPLQISIQGNFVSFPGLVTVTDFHLLCTLLLSSINTLALPTIKYNKDRNQVSKTSKHIETVTISPLKVTHPTRLSTPT